MSARRKRDLAAALVGLIVIGLAIALWLGHSSTSHPKSGPKPIPTGSTGNLQGILSGSTRALPPDFLGLNGANTRTQRVAWSSAELQHVMATLSPGNFRIFGGTTANYWNWKSGLFVTGFPDEAGDYASYNRYGGPPIRLQDWANLAKVAHATPIFDLNMVTSTLTSQLAMLHEASQLGLPVTRVELGNELWESDRPILAAFPNASAYKTTATQWASQIHSAFPSAQIAAVGYGQVAGDPRKTTWDAQVGFALPGQHAVTFHTYFAPNSATVSGADPRAASLFAGVTARLARLRSETLSHLPQGDTAWITEFGLNVIDQRDSGLWMQGLADAQYAMGLALEPQVGLTDLQGLVGGQLGVSYATTTGLSFRQALGTAVPPRTTAYSLGPAGTTFRELSQVIGGGATIQRIDFATGTASDSDVQGVVARSGGTTRVLLLNLGPNSASVNLPSSVEVKGLRYNEITASPLQPVTSASSVSTSAGSASDQLTLKPYSITAITH